MIEVYQADLRQCNLVEVRFELLGLASLITPHIKDFFVSIALENEFLKLVVRYFAGAATHNHPLVWILSRHRLNVATSILVFIIIRNSLFFVQDLQLFVKFFVILAVRAVVILSRQYTFSKTFTTWDMQCMSLFRIFLLVDEPKTIRFMAVHAAANLTIVRVTSTH